jgi:uncharacterized membrane protein
LVLLGPIFAVFPHAFTLLVVQNALFGLAAAALTYSAIRLLGPRTGTLFGFAFAFSWGLQGAVEAQFHEIAFAVPLLALSLTAFLRRRWVACLLWAMPLVFVKEDLGLTVAALGIVLAVRSRRPLGIWLAVWAWAGSRWQAWLFCRCSTRTGRGPIRAASTCSVFWATLRQCFSRRRA